LKDLNEIIREKNIKLKTIYEIHWLSMGDAVSAIIRNYKALLLLPSEEAGAICAMLCGPKAHIKFGLPLSKSWLKACCSLRLSSIFPSIDGNPVGQHPLVIRFLEAVFESRPAMPHFTAVWAVNQVLDYFVPC